MIDWTEVFKTVDWGAVFKTLGGAAVIGGALAFVAKAAIKQLLTRDIANHKEALTRETADYKEELTRRTQKELLTLNQKGQEQLLAQKNAFDTQMGSFKVEVEADAARKDRIRDQVSQWANPILDAVRGLEARLDNILSDEGYLALSRETQSKVNPEWTISYDYFYPTTIYHFSQYFCWIRLFEEHLSFELFTTHLKKIRFLKKCERLSAL